MSAGDGVIGLRAADVKAVLLRVAPMLLGSDLPVSPPSGRTTKLRNGSPVPPTICTAVLSNIYCTYCMCALVCVARGASQPSRGASREPLDLRREIGPRRGLELGRERSEEELRRRGKAA